MAKKPNILRRNKKLLKRLSSEINKHQLAIEFFNQVMLLKFLLFTIGVVAFAVVVQKQQISFSDITTLVNRWDGLHYVNIAQHGYQSSGPDRLLLVFFPLYPLCIHIVDLLLHDTVVSALVVSTICSLLLVVAFYRLVIKDETSAVAKRAVWWLLIFPTAYFLHLGFTESLFLLTIIMSFKLAREQKWALAGLMGLLAGLTRINGALLVPALMTEAYMIYKKTKKIQPQWLFCLLPAMGTVIYLVINWVVSGKFLTFLTYLHDNWYKSSTTPWYGIYSLWQSTAHQFTTSNLITSWAELTALTISIVVCILSWKKLRPSYTVWMITNTVLWSSTTFILSTPRYLLAAFPMFILLGRLKNDRLANQILQFISISLLIIFWLQFSGGRWAF